MTWFDGRKRRWILIILILAIGGFFAIKGGMAPTPIQYQTVKVTHRDLQQNVLATGKLDAVRKVDVGAQVSGQLERLYVAIGDKVKQGQLLAMIDPQQAQNQIKEVEATLQDLNAQLLQAKAEQQLAEVTLRRQQALAKLQAVSRQELDQAATTLTVKKANVSAIDAQINKAKASLATANINLDYTKISAPMDGDVVQITTLQGQTVIAAQQAPNILTLADMSTMLVNAQVSEADVIHLKPGLKASFTVLGDPSKSFDGVLKDIQPTPEKVNDAIFYSARFEVPNPNGVLRLQMTAQVSIQLAKVENAKVIPLSALGNELGVNRYEVAILKEGKEQPREVTIGIRNNVDAQILSGLEVGDEVITSRGVAEKT
ncbi:macrolide transporter subunit MacA [Yersinia ruckeri]|uniref:Macrolide transporter subunit MacA n=1 Tax=Yersinia ruckeri TaxID=29486 RepID=A0A085U9T3_YERRU|nr:macrolide transporter subunit MacA [Yersinia ruckeri]AKA39807.1 macrolide transporter [Yersinia ruckeri]ARZ01490.1 macrolide transporter subunit MacA [Yersinia ruckeri]AUQ43474.1 macrolide transporter subunit MacA [Yersinia ruckeri]EKN3345163.1 macrolide transporter subunit MacA [Yersinia ruckeri]EKN3360582.1 macrolide transporter subunit MacA [Yersinia ruckeri]